MLNTHFKYYVIYHFFLTIIHLPPQLHPQLPHAVGTAPIRAKPPKCISGNGFQQQALASQGQIFHHLRVLRQLGPKKFLHHRLFVKMQAPTLANHQRPLAARP